MKRLVTFLFMGSLLIAGGLAFAGGDSDSGSADGPMEISWLGIGGAPVLIDDGPIQGALEEKFNVNFTNFPQDARPIEVIDLMIASGEHPDAMYSWTNHDQWYAAGAYRSIPQSTVREHAPLLAGVLDEIGPAAWLFTGVPGTGGEQLQGIPRQWAHQAGAQAQPTIRLDWFEDVGMATQMGFDPNKTPSPTSPEGLQDVNPLVPGRFFQNYAVVNIDDLEEGLERIIAADPAGGGRTIGMTAWNRDGRPCYWQGWGIVCQAYSVSAESRWIHGNADGNAVPFHIFDNVLTSVETLQRFWSKGLLDPETPTVDNATARAKQATGFVAIWNLHNVTCMNEENMESGGGWTCDAARANPESRWAKFLGVSAPDGTWGQRHENPSLPMSPPGEWFVVKHDVDDNKLARILQIYDYTAFSCEGQLLTEYGVEGTHYTKEGSDSICNGSEYVKGNARAVRTQLAADMLATENTVGFSYYRHHAWAPRNYGYLAPNPSWPVAEAQEFNQCIAPGGACTGNLIQMYAEDVFKETDYDQLVSQFWGGLQAIHGEWFYSTMVSDTPAAQTWDAYLRQYKAAGGQRLIDELAKLQYTAADLRAGRVSQNASGQYVAN